MVERYKIKWDGGYGLSSEYVKCENMEEAEEMAYSRWLGDAEFQAEYSAELVDEADIPKELK